MEKPTKEETITLIQKLKNNGYSLTDIGSQMGMTAQTVWAWSSDKTSRTPSIADFQFMLGLLK